MSIKHFMQEIEKGLKAPVYFLYAEDPYLLKEASLMAERTIPGGERDFSVNHFDLDGIDDVPPFEQIMDAVNTIPFMGKQKVVIIENIQELAKKDMEHLGRYTANPSPYCVLMLLHRGSPKAQFKELMKEVKKADLVVFPSLYESQPMFALEAMACQKPVVAFDLPYAREIIVNGKNGLLAKAYDLEDLCNKTATALCDKNLRMSLGQNGYDYVKRNHDWDAQAGKYLKVYEALIADGK